MNRRMHALVMALVLLLAVVFGSGQVSAAPAAAWSIDADSTDGVLTVCLTLENGQGVTNGRVVLGYDAQALTLSGVKAADHAGLISLNTDAEGEVALAWVGSEITADAQLMLTVTFAGTGSGTVLTAQTQEAWTNGTQVQIADAALEIKGNPFVDITGHWAEEYILKVYHAGIFKGLSDTIFAPNQPMNRAMFVTVLYRIAGEPQVDSGKLVFSDVPADSFYTEAVAWAVEQGITNGVSTSLFAPDRHLSRQELVTMFYRYVKSTGADVSATADLSAYPDADTLASWAVEPFGWAVEAGIIHGMDDGTLSPTSTAVRAQVAAILSRWMGL